MAGHSVAMRNDGVNATCRDGGANWFGLYEGDPTAGGVEVAGGAYARVEAIPGDADNGSVTFPDAEIEVPGGGTHPDHWARFSTAAGGSPYDSGPLANNGETFNSPGSLTVTLTSAMPA
jgi:hypothetical protein